MTLEEYRKLPSHTPLEELRSAYSSLSVEDKAILAEENRQERARKRLHARFVEETLEPIAVRAMQGLLASPEPFGDDAAIARQAYEMAQAMVSEKKRVIDAVLEDKPNG